MAGIVTWIFLEILRTLTWAPQHAKVEQRVFNTREALYAQWTADGGRPENFPKVDFTKESVIAVFAGPQPNPGHEVNIHRIEYSEDHKAVRVLYRYLKPEPGKKYPQVIVHPSFVVVVGKINAATSVTFINQDSVEGQNLMAAKKLETPPEEVAAGKDLMSRFAEACRKKDMEVFERLLWIEKIGKTAEARAAFSALPQLDWSSYAFIDLAVASPAEKASHQNQAQGVLEVYTITYHIKKTFNSDVETRKATIIKHKDGYFVSFD